MSLPVHQDSKGSMHPNISDTPGSHRRTASPARKIHFHHDPAPPAQTIPYGELNRALRFGTPSPRSVASAPATAALAKRNKKDVEGPDRAGMYDKYTCQRQPHKSGRRWGVVLKVSDRNAMSGGPSVYDEYMRSQFICKGGVPRARDGIEHYRRDVQDVVDEDDDEDDDDDDDDESGSVAESEAAARDFRDTNDVFGLDGDLHLHCVDGRVDGSSSTADPARFKEFLQAQYECVDGVVRSHKRPVETHDRRAVGNVSYPGGNDNGGTPDGHRTAVGLWVGVAVLVSGLFVVGVVGVVVWAKKRERKRRELRESARKVVVEEGLEFDMEAGK